MCRNFCFKTKPHPSFLAFVFITVSFRIPQIPGIFRRNRKPGFFGGKSQNPRLKIHFSGFVNGSLIRACPCISEGVLSPCRGTKKRKPAGFLQKAKHNPISAYTERRRRKSERKKEHMVHMRMGIGIIIPLIVVLMAFLLSLKLAVIIPHTFPLVKCFFQFFHFFRFFYSTAHMTVPN